VKKKDMVTKKILFKTIVGSTAYGCDITGSDTDLKFVYAQPNDDVLGYNYVPNIVVDKDSTGYEIREFIRLLSKGSPTILEMIFAPQFCVLELHPAFNLLLDNADKFLTKRTKNAYIGFCKQGILDIEKEKKNPNKTLYHVRRLIDSAIEIAVHQTLTVYNSNNNQYLRDIRLGYVGLDGVLESAKKDLGLIDELYEKSNLPEDVDKDFMQWLLIETRNKINWNE
jgi:predicted nucleotidyltransferase